jgi:hypothetical protein
MEFYSHYPNITKGKVKGGEEGEGEEKEKEKVINIYGVL